MEQDLDRLKVLHWLALKEAGAFAQKSLRSGLLRLDYSDIKTISSLRSLLERHRLDGAMPTEQQWNSARETLEKSAELGISVIPLHSRLYPKSLAAIDNPPMLLHVRGDADLLQRLPGVAVVGARAASAAGKVIAKRIAHYLAERDWIVVSGLALGIDAAAHEGALRSGMRGSTIAVLAGGLDKPQPPRNADLAYKILDTGGLWVSEHPIGTPSKREHFVPRNRIQLGLSAGSVIVEASTNSGSITQAKFCLKQKRPLFAVVPMVDTEFLGLVSDGTQLLVAEFGATPITSRDTYGQMLEKLDFQRELIQSIP